MRRRKYKIQRLSRRYTKSKDKHFSPLEENQSLRPSLDDHEAWHVYWQSLELPWRTEPEIDLKRQQELEDQRGIVPDIEQGIYPFKGLKLSRADIEWLLATHENGRGPVDWCDEDQRNRKGLDLRGADLRDVDLSDLPLTRMIGGASLRERLTTTLPQRSIAVVHLERANLAQTHLEGAILRNAHLSRSLRRLDHRSNFYRHFDSTIFR